MTKDVVVSYLPAQPNYYIVWPADASVESHHEIAISPIIGWSIKSYTIDGEPRAWAEPITTETLPHSYLIMNPDKTVLRPECETYKNLAEYLASLKIPA